MKKIHIADGVDITDISMGAGSLGNPDREDICFALLDRYVEMGGNCMDTARVYGNGNTDVMLGRWIKSRRHRDKMVLCAKGCHPARENMFVNRLSPKDITGDLEESLSALQTDHADMFLLHRDDSRMPVDTIMQTLHALVKAGKTLAVGCSNWTVGRINEANQFARKNGLTPFSVCQLHYGLAQTTAAQTRDITHVPMSPIEAQWYREEQFPIMGFGCQGRGFYARYAAGAEQKEGTRQFYMWLPENLRRADRLIKLAADLHTNVSALAVAYARDSGLRCSALCAFSSLAQMEESFDALRLALTPAQIAYLESGA